MTVEIEIDLPVEELSGNGISIQDKLKERLSFDYEYITQKIIDYVIDKAGFPYEAEVNLMLTNDAGIQAVNAKYRQIERPTDVLSFPMIEYEKAGDFSQVENAVDNFNPDTGEAVLGDIIINLDMAQRQAKSFGHSLLREFAFLLVHSLLHLFGYDHMQPKDAAVMEDLQKTILEELNILR